MPSLEWELQKRAFWILVYQDRLASSVFGHICSVIYFGFNTDLLLQVDDEHWDHPTHLEAPSLLPYIHPKTPHVIPCPLETPATRMASLEMWEVVEEV
ncbi:hypothetical protein DFH08DRAFT_970676 [Mycena albidolilacea]|uniref:Transcription factor domain-containing protein n=1 Tax=Mycena albidolilacea TaxID=1033008 RepID=A0AAD7EGQ3_9AGAR|nr:hypothetical protein DFH08DRAFT_970676 [Mycena albidolilacea]